MPKYLTTLELHKETMKFSAGHTTIFSATERERLHGHMYTVSLALTLWVEDNGMAFDYRYYKERIHLLCSHLNQTFLMPQFSPYLGYEEDEHYLYFIFNHKKIPFLREDVTVLPLTNITVEELSRWFVMELIKEKDELARHHIEQLVVTVFSAPGQSANHQWFRELAK